MQKDSSHIPQNVMPLTFGAVISLSPPESPDSFIYVDGFIKDKIMVKNYDHIDSKPNYFKSLFQIYPSFINTYKKEALALKDPANLSKTPIGHRRTAMINGLQDKVATEFNFNLETFKKVTGQPVLFGQTIQLLHIASNKFLACTNDEAQIERENYKVNLNEFSSDVTMFKFLPCYKHQKESEGIIYIDDSIYIASNNAILNKTPFLHISTPTAISLRKKDRYYDGNTKSENEAPDSARNEVTKPRYKIEVNASLETQTRLRINYYTNYQPETTNLLECGDIVWLNHSELNATLVCITEFKNNVFDYQIEFDISNVMESFKRFVGNTNGMWLIEHSVYKNGGIVRWGQPYRFKHLSSGLYLSTKMTKKKGGDQNSLKITLEKEPNEDNLFTFIPISGAQTTDQAANKLYVTKDTFVLISQKKTGLLLQATLSKEHDSKKTSNQNEEGMTLVSQTKPCMINKGAGSEEATFKIIKANYTEVWETNFLISCFPLLKGFLESITLLHYKASTNKLWANHVLNKMQSARKCVQDLDLFCKNELFNNSPDQKYGETNVFRQKLLKEQFFIDVLAMILKETISVEELRLVDKWTKGNTNELLDPDKFSEEENLASRKSSYIDMASARPDEKRSEKENVEYIKKKVQFCHTIYSLLVSICKGNYENEIYTFNLIPMFLIHCKYIPEAVECIISIIGSNETILTKMRENVKIDIDRNINRNIDDNIINVIINIKDSENLIDGNQKINPSFFTGLDQSRVSKPINLINFFLNLLKQKSETAANVHYLKFFRKICTQNKVGVTINQDMLFKIFMNNPNFVQRTMITFSCDDNDITAEFPAHWTGLSGKKIISFSECYQEQDGIISSNNIKSLEEQLKLYSDLALSRNYLWKSLLEELFPLHFVFNGIWNPQYSKTMRASLCMLALTVYIDHEPFNQLILPKMCRVYQTFSKKYAKKRRSSDIDGVDEDNLPVSVFTRNSSTNVGEMKNQLSGLINSVVNYLEKEVEIISDELRDTIETKKNQRNIEKEIHLAVLQQNQALKINTKDFLNDVLLLNVVQMFSKLVKFDVLGMAKKQNMFYTVTNIFVRLLEYDQKNPAYSYLLMKQRDANVKKRIEIEKNKNAISMSGLKSLLSSVVENVTDITGTIGGLLNLTQNKTVTQNKKGAVDEIEDQNQFNNPTMRNMISLQYSLERLKYEEDKKDKADIEVKLEVLDTLDFLLDMRKNYMVTNFLAWHQALESDMKKYTKANKVNKFDRKLEMKFNEALPKFLPPIAKTGLLDIDEKFAVAEKEEVDKLGLTNLLNNIKNVGSSNEKKFTDFAKDSGDFAYDLDSLVLGHESGQEGVTSELLPSLLVTFLTTKDTVLESRLLDVLMRLFNQRAELIDTLQKLEILFDPKEIKTYQYVERESARLKDYVEKLEIWLEDYVTSEKPGAEIEEVINIIKNLTLLLDSNNYIEENGEMRIIDVTEEKSVSVSRQNIMKYLRTHKSMVMVSKEGIHVLEKIILDDQVNIAKKRKMVELFTRAHEFLREFCRSNEGNQNILAEYKETFIEHARIDVGQIDLLCEMYDGNKRLCESISESFLEKFISLIESEGRQANFLKFFMVIQKSRDVYIQENQIRVFKTLINNEESDTKSIYKTLYMNHQTKDEVLRFEFNDFVPSNENKDLIDKLAEFGFRDTYRDEPFIYHEQLLDVLIETMRGSEGFNMNKAKLKTLFSFQYLMELLLHPDAFTSTDQLNTIHESISDQILAYKPEELQKIRMSLQKTDQLGDGGIENAAEKYQIFEVRKQGFTKIKGKLIEFIMELFFGPNTKLEDPILVQKHFVRLIEKETARFGDISAKTEMDPGFLDYFFGSVLGLCNEYISKFLSVAVLEEEGRRKDNIALYKLAVMVGHKLVFFEKKLHVHHMRNLRSFMEKYIDFSQHDIEERINLLTGDEGHSPFMRPREPSDQKSFMLSDNDAISWASKNNWDRLMGIITNGQLEWQKPVDDEKRALSQAVLNFSKLFSAEDQEKHKISLNPKDLIKKFVKYLQYGSSNKAKKETMIATLQTLIKMVDVEDPKEKVELQNMLDKYEATKMVLTVLSDSSNLSMDPEVFNNFLELGIKLLEGGNVRIQKNIYNYFITFQKSEAIFAKFSNVITTFSNRLKRLNNTDTLELEIVDLAEEYSNLGPIILENILRLLQLFTEGHYTDLQNYIRVQTNSRNSYDMVSAVTELLRSYLNHMSQANYESIMRCLSTLAEFVQGPCYENQQSLIDGKFFEVVNTILTYSFKNGRSTLSPAKSQERLTRKQTFVMALKQSMERWMIARIKYQTMILVTSLLEQRKDDTTIKRIMRSLPLDIVKKHLCSVWKTYKALYGTKYVTESLGHNDGDPKTDRERAKPKDNQKYAYYDLITESGFAAYFLLESYYKLIDHDDDERVLNEVRAKKMQSNTQEDSLIRSSVFGQLGSFLISIVKQGLDTAEILKNQINKGLVHLGLDEDESEKLRKELRHREMTREGIKFFAEHSASIEVVRNKEIEKIFFYLQPFCHELPKEIKMNFHDNVNRVSVQSKVNGLMQSSDDIIRTMEYEYKLGLFFNKYKLIALFANHVTLWQDLSYTLAVVLNFFILVSYSDEFSDDPNILERRMRNPRLFLISSIVHTDVILAIIGLVLLVSSMFVVLFYLVKKMPLVIEKVWKNSEKNEKQKKKSLVGRLLSFLTKVCLILFELLQSYEIVYYLLYGIMAIIGVVIHPFFFAFHLTVIIIRYPTLKNVVMAFWEPRKALGLTLVLFIILEYIASLFGFIFFVEDYQGFCEKAVDCFLYTFDFTFKANGGIGGQLDSIYKRPDGYYTAGRFFFDNLFNLFLVIIMVSIVTGIIIDTFGSLREKDNEKNADIRDICFICGNDKETFDRKSDAQGGFKQHIKIDHYMWNYVFYIAYLKCKDKLDYTGIESYIAKKLKSGEASWFPLRKALVLEDIKDEEEKQREQLNQIETNIGETMKMSSNVSRNLKQTLRRLEKHSHFIAEDVKDQK